MWPDIKGGFEDIPKDTWKQPCWNPQHEPPMHMVIPPGKQYRHVCPGCHQETVICPLDIRFHV